MRLKVSNTRGFFSELAFYFFGFLLFFKVFLVHAAEQQAPPPEFYRGLNLTLRPSAKFKLPLPSPAGAGEIQIQYRFQWGDPLWKQPDITDVSMVLGTVASVPIFVRNFVDKIFLREDSVLKVGGEELPLTCVYIDAKDNRFSGKNTPLIPDFFFSVYLVVGSFDCQGPINPGWPFNGKERELWNTYLYYEIRDPTLMLPTAVKLRYRSNEYSLVLGG